MNMAALVGHPDLSGSETWCEFEKRYHSVPTVPYLDVGIILPDDPSIFNKYMEEGIPFGASIGSFLMRNKIPSWARPGQEVWGYFNETNDRIVIYDDFDHWASYPVDTALIDDIIPRVFEPDPNQLRPRPDPYGVLHNSRSLRLSLRRRILGRLCDLGAPDDGVAIFHNFIDIDRIAKCP